MLEAGLDYGGLVKEFLEQVRAGQPFWAHHASDFWLSVQPWAWCVCQVHLCRRLQYDLVTSKPEMPTCSQEHCI